MKMKMNVMRSNEHVGISVHHSDQSVVVVDAKNTLLDYSHDMYQVDVNMNLNDDSIHRMHRDHNLNYDDVDIMYVNAEDGIEIDVDDDTSNHRYYLYYCLMM